MGQSLFPRTPCMSFDWYSYVTLSVMCQINAELYIYKISYFDEFKSEKVSSLYDELLVLKENLNWWAVFDGRTTVRPCKKNLWNNLKLRISFRRSHVKDRKCLDSDSPNTQLFFTLICFHLKWACNE